MLQKDLEKGGNIDNVQKDVPHRSYTQISKAIERRLSVPNAQ